ncbi:MAG: 30S ribosomal protein S9 [Candidatus Uhrbacteria bacterium GW2011_GWF2_41_16]|uniref:Small ribosomal subunit protein uS9 n=2 Tax=Candidatus Uhriibacteriota TaxID=1752732 RepID=A0A0G0VC67_9BACT|nr:MAG: 30S ribosomal protein S9 [Candidatus Uhrbacteria bacterium GW2011_GWA2_41_10]KKR86089.1 MAG: 30S ribosomal protein S9 [Candidatus Uhrbacteria bacterium GW2011_GWC2_41_11]KKR97221.1 MAG: 30S ribosomal protein S9 [Candidatus Uhrbacteria bacterium GW2011_GWF2_41_16]HBP00432.1 30S ribosomal protein S9 [Candidatus Uhrbacteria bacterium]
MPVTEKTTQKYTHKIGRRKEAAAQVRLFASGTGVMTVNGRPYQTYFPHSEWQSLLLAPFVTSGMEGKFDVVATVKGGGIRGQAESIRLGIARALCVFNPEFRTALKKLGYLTRDPRVKERKKYGKKKARRSPQWSKR